MEASRVFAEEEGREADEEASKSLLHTEEEEEEEGHGMSSGTDENLISDDEEDEEDEENTMDALLAARRSEGENIPVMYRGDGDRGTGIEGEQIAIQREEKNGGRGGEEAERMKMMVYKEQVIVEYGQSLFF